MRRKVKTARRPTGPEPAAAAVRHAAPPAELVARSLAVLEKEVVAPIPRHANKLVQLPEPGKTVSRTKAKTAASQERARGAIRIFQIFYDDWHKQLLDPEFQPFDNSNASSELHEFAVFEKLAESPRVAGATHWGALSWRFTEKTGLSGKALLDAMAAKPGFDAYFCNPFPANEALYHNLWAQGDVAHPDFLALTRAFFAAAGLPREQVEAIQPSSVFSSSNYFVATPVFWAAYLKFIRRALGSAERALEPRMRSLLHSKVADPQGFHFGATYVPFIVERLFPVFLKTQGSSLKVCKLPLPEREKELNVHMKLLRDMRDVAHKTSSFRMAACWVNYRNLYLNHVNGREWCNKHIRNITPTQVQFL
jgi:hypothetical protein